MPCDSGYLEATALERHLSRAYLLLDEVRTGRHVNSKSSEWRGYDRRAYGEATEKLLSTTVAQLCAEITKLTPAQRAKHSLELQVWWRDHLVADAARVRREQRANVDKKLRAAALKKLTKAERRALGLKG